MTGTKPPSTSSLHGVRVLVPRARQQAAELSDRIRQAGGHPVEAPVLLIEPGDTDGLDTAVRGLAAGRYEAICFTSPNGVAGVTAAMARACLDPSTVAGVNLIACVGPGTARALHEQLGLTPDLVPDTATTAALGEAMPQGAGEVLLPRADIASPVLPRLLAAKGYTPVEVVAYRTTRPADLPDAVLDDLRDGGIDLIAVASPSTARHLVALLEGRSWKGRIVSIGPVTTAACVELGLSVATEADPHDLDGLVDALSRADP